jgi:hypothetical protein
MKTEDRRVCPRCGSEFSGAMAFCPICMLRGVLDQEVGVFSEQAFNEPTLEIGPFEHFEPDNIMVSFEEGGVPTAKIIDLGLAKPVIGSNARSTDRRTPSRSPASWSPYGGTHDSAHRRLALSRAPWGRRSYRVVLPCPVIDQLHRNAS